MYLLIFNTPLPPPPHYQCCHHVYCALLVVIMSPAVQYQLSLCFLLYTTNCPPVFYCALLLYRLSSNPSGLQHPCGPALLSGPTPRRCVPCARGAVHSLEKRLGCQGHQHGGIPIPLSFLEATWLYSPWRHGWYTKWKCAL